MRLVWLFIFIVCITGGCSQASSDTPASATRPEASPAAETSDVALKILDYDEIQRLIQDKKGKVVVMDAWSTSCPPCMKEFPHLVELHHEYGPDKVACVSLSFDYEGIDRPEDQQDRVLAFLRKQKATFDNILNKEEADDLYQKLDLDAVPAVFVYDQSGKLRQKFDDSYRNAAGQRFSYTDVRALVKELLSET